MEYNKQYLSRQLNRNLPRRIIRKIYLLNTRKFIKGPTIDFGCGPGDLLKLLPPGSIGYDVNPYAIEKCKKALLDAKTYYPEIDKYMLLNTKTGKYTTFLASHILEHLKNPVDVLNILFKTCYKKQIKRLVLIVPGKKGFALDRSHKAYVDKKTINSANSYGYTLTHQKYFPINSAFISKIFPYNELISVYDKKS